MTLLLFEEQHDALSNKRSTLFQKGMCLYVTFLFSVCHIMVNCTKNWSPECGSHYLISDANIGRFSSNDICLNMTSLLGLHIARGSIRIVENQVG